MATKAPAFYGLLDHVERHYIVIRIIIRITIERKVVPAFLCVIQPSLLR